jgi:hypothetical protein
VLAPEQALDPRDFFPMYAELLDPPAVSAEAAVTRIAAELG